MHNMRHVDSNYDVWQFLYGFLDGSVYGKSANLTACSTYAQDVSTVYYFNWYYLFENEATIESNFNVQNQEASIRLIFQYIQKMLQWPYQVSLNCYWGTAMLWVPYEYQQYPNIFYERLNDGTYKQFTFGE